MRSVPQEIEGAMSTPALIGEMREKGERHPPSARRGQGAHPHRIATPIHFFFVAHLVSPNVPARRAKMSPDVPKSPAVSPLSRGRKTNPPRHIRIDAAAARV